MDSILGYVRSRKAFPVENKHNAIAIHQVLSTRSSTHDVIVMI
jgi:hypothetical protein